MNSFFPGTVDPQSAFADALARARQIAAKIGNPTPEAAAEAAALKRPFEGSPDNQPEAKKVATAGPDITAQLRLQAIAGESNMDHDLAWLGGDSRSQAVQQAAAAASQLNQKLGTTAAGGPPPLGQLGPHAGLGAVLNEDFRVPDRMVGLIIGKGGEQIASIQAESGCKVQFAPDSGGMPDRMATLTGSAEAVMAAKELIMKIIQRGSGAPDGEMNGNTTMIEIMVPGNKVGLVIGKGGETIRQLQERAGVKMVMIQDSNQPSMCEKPLRITGDHQKCQHAKELIMELIQEKDMDGGGGGGGGGNMGNFGEFGGGGGGGGMGGKNLEIRVPRSAVGVIIGKGGEMIKKIQTETGARVQFLPDDGQSAERICSISGTPEKMHQAAGMIQDLINSAMVRDQNRQGGPMGRGRGRGRGDMPPGPGGRFGDNNGGGPRPGGMPSGPPGGRGFRDGNFPDETQFPVPAEKCGLVIGKGGETIRQINSQSGAHVELQRAPGPNPGEKLFTIRGSPQQIQHAMQLIADKAGIPPPSNGGGPGPGPGPNGPGGPGPNGPGGPGGPGPGGPSGPGGFDQYGGQFGGPGGQYGQQNQGPPQNQNFAAPQGWNNNYGGQWQNPSNPNEQQDKNQGGGGDQNAAAWAAYYAQYYGNSPNQQQPQQPQQPPQQQPQQPAAAQQATVNPNTGQLDYSQAWAEYYRQQGMHYHAQAILQQAGQPSHGMPTNPQGAPQQ